MSVVANIRGLRSWLDRDDISHEVLDLVAAVPTALARLYRSSRGLVPIQPRDDLGTVANVLWMLEGVEPDAHRVRSLEAYLILTVDHGFNASTFASRVVASTGADVGASVVAGIAALSGPLHGGAPSLVVEMLSEIGCVDAARDWARRRLESGGVIMGFGHRVYRTEDPRSVMLAEVASSLGGPFVDLAVGVREVLLDELGRHRPGREIRTNVEYFAGVVLHQLGIDPVLYPSLFAISRSAGWGAHILEQVANNRIYRPTSAYVGLAAPAPLPAREESARAS
jgi:citrate synthase